MSEERSGLEILADVIREHYDLGEVRKVEYLQDAHQRRHRKVVATTDADKFLVKTYSTDPHVLDALRFQHRLSDHLGAHSLPVASIQRAIDGKGIVEQGTWALELQRFVEGVPMVVNDGTLTVSAKALGRFHDVCREFPCPPRDAQIWRFSEVPRASFAKLYELARRLGDAAVVDEHCNAVALFLHEAAGRLSPAHREQFETGLIHGDWHGGNLLFDSKGLVAIVDLEFAGQGCYLEDLAYGISNLCIRTSKDTRQLAARTDVLLDYYQMYRTLSPYEHIALFYAVGVKHVATVSYQITELGGQVAGLDALQWMDVLAAQCAWLSGRGRRARGAD